jgi:hypothetical protein
LTITKENTIENIIRVIGLWLKKCGDSALFWFCGRRPHAPGPECKHLQMRLDRCFFGAAKKHVAIGSFSVFILFDFCFCLCYTI